MRDRRYVAEGAVVLAAFLFGVTFVLVQDAVEDITAASYVFFRFTIGALALAPFAYLAWRRHPAVTGVLWRASLVAGALLLVAYILQTVGLQYTEASTSAFITGLYSIVTPIIEAIVRRRSPPMMVWVGILVAVTGLFLLTGAELTLGRGELLTLGCAIAFAVWIVYQGGYAGRLPTMPFMTLQMVVIAGLAMPITAVTGVGELTAVAVFAVAFTGIACSSIALTLQLYGQVRLSPSRTGLILLLEPVFAGVFGYLAGDRLGALKLTGAAIILVGIALAELAPEREASMRSAVAEGTEQ